MGSLLDIRKKISSVKNTRKITRAMQLVATSKMKSFQKKAHSTRKFVLDLMETLSQNLITEYHSKLEEKRNSGKTLFIIYNSDKGLCGPLNLNINKTLIRSNKWQSLSEDNKLLITIGKKASEFAKTNQIPIHKNYDSLPENLKVKDVLPIIDEVLTLWNKKNTDKTPFCKEVIFVVPEFFNTFTFYPKLKLFLPFSIEMIKSHKELSVEKSSKQTENFMIYEPNQKHVLEFLFLQITKAIFIQSFFELKASEYSNRMIAMKNATDSADKIVNNLNLTYNKTRQQIITQELAELIGASESI